MGHYDDQREADAKKREEGRKERVAQMREKHAFAIKCFNEVFWPHTDKVEAFLRDKAADPNGEGV